jgi:hypothetical protein
VGWHTAGFVDMEDRSINGINAVTNVVFVVNTDVATDLLWAPIQIQIDPVKKYTWIDERFARGLNPAGSLGAHSLPVSPTLIPSCGSGMGVPGGLCDDSSRLCRASPCVCAETVGIEPTKMRCLVLPWVSSAWLNAMRDDIWTSHAPRGGLAGIGFKLCSNIPAKT